MTGFRERDFHDVTIVRAIKDVLKPLSVSIFPVVGDPLLPALVDARANRAG